MNRDDALFWLLVRRLLRGGNLVVCKPTRFHNTRQAGTVDRLGAVMARSKNDLELLSINELWELHQKVLATLRAKIKAQTKMLEQRLKQVNARLRDK